MLMNFYAVNLPVFPLIKGGLIKVLFQKHCLEISRTDCIVLMQFERILKVDDCKL